MVKKKTKSKAASRPVVVVILGHVDHGKTTLLDRIRKTNVAERETGGITQKIGASVVETKDGEKITFIDTPGHAAFSNMRARGAEVADIAVLVIASDDGVKPQTSEALKYILDTKTPYVVVATKIDLKTADVEVAKHQLENEGVKFEGNGGNTPLVEVSAKEGRGIDDLLEMIALLSQLNEIAGRSDDDLLSVVFETTKDHRGVLVSVVVKGGTLEVGQVVEADGVATKIRALFDAKGKSVKRVNPGFPAQVMGFKDAPSVGSEITAAAVVSAGATSSTRPADVEKVEEGERGVVIRANSKGALEAILQNIPEGIVVLKSGVGGVTEGDIFFAKASNAHVLAFDVKITSGVKKLADTDDVSLSEYGVIYELFEKLIELASEGKEVVSGRAEILAEFPFNKQRVAGSKIIQGKIGVGDKIVLMRNDEKVGAGRVISMRKQKKEIGIANEGEEFGAIIKPKIDFKVGDMILSVRK